MVVPLASHITSKGMDQFGAMMIRADIKSSLRQLKDLIHSPSNSNFTSFSRCLNKGVSNLRIILDKMPIELSVAKKTSNTSHRNG